MRGRARTFLATVGVLGVLGAVAACERAKPAAHGPPAAEFLFAAGDSTYWVRSGDEGMRVRSAPILLTQVDGHFYEVFIAEEGVDYEDAAFTAARVFSRDITQRDSVSLFDDGRVMKEADAWHRRHPREMAIDPESEDIPPDPATVVSEEIEILDVHGPWVTFNHLLDIDVADHEPHRHAGHRYVVDVRTGARGTLETLFGATEAARLVAAGRASFQQLTDSIRHAGGERAAQARETLDSFHFDTLSFGLTDVTRSPAVSFMVPGTGVDGEALALNLPPIAAQAPAWWNGVQATLPTWSADSSLVRWSRTGYDVIARPTAENESLALALVPSGGASGTGTPITTEWPIATVPAPAYQLVPLDAPRLSQALHDALARAFDASKSHEGGVQTAARSSGRGHESHATVLPVRWSHAPRHD